MSQRVEAVRAGPKRKVLVTGAAGFIGSHVAEYTSKVLGFETVAVDDLSGGFIRNVPDGLAFVNVDLKEAEDVASLFETHGPFDYVYHLAAYAAEGLSHFIRRFNYRNNLEVTASLINQAVIGKVKCFVFTSSIAAYGNPATLPFIEETPQQPEDPYGVAKLAAEYDLKAAHSMFGSEYVIFLPHNVYGPKQNLADKFRNAVGIFLNQIMKGEHMTIFGDGGQMRAFSYIDDVAPLIALAPEVPAARQQSFFIGSDQKYSVLELSERAAKAMGVEHRVTHLEKRKEVELAYARHDKLHCFFNPPPAVDLDEGLARTAAYAKKMGSFSPTGYQHIEVWDQMPSSWAKALKAWEADALKAQAVPYGLDRPDALLLLVLAVYVLVAYGCGPLQRMCGGGARLRARRRTPKAKLRARRV